LFGKYSSLGEETQLVYGYRLAPTQMGVLDLIEAGPALSLLYLESHPPQSYLCLALAEHTIETHGVNSSVRFSLQNSGVVRSTVPENTRG
jgi:hypothetical protein